MQAAAARIGRYRYAGWLVGLSLVLAGCGAPPADPVSAPSASPAETPVADTTVSESISEPEAPATAEDTAVVAEASFSGEPGAYQVSVTVTSPDTGCDQYADWWEVLTPEGELLYRRILAHSHVDEQPFTRSGGPVAIAPTDPIIIRVHMNNTGYSAQALTGTVAEGLSATTLLIDPEGDAAIASQPPQPSGCAF